MLKDQFGIIQMSPIPQTIFLVGTFFAISYSKTALVGLHWGVRTMQQLEQYKEISRKIQMIFGIEDAKLLMSYFELHQSRDKKV